MAASCHGTFKFTGNSLLVLCVPVPAVCLHAFVGVVLSHACACRTSVNGVSTVAEAVGERLAPHVKKHGAKLIQESLRKSKDGQASSMDGAKLVAVTSLQGRADANLCFS